MEMLDLDYIIEWIDTRKNKYYKIGWAYLGNKQDIEDAFHNTILKAYDNVNQLRNKSSFEAWVTKIFINECRTILNKRIKNEPMVDMDIAVYDNNSSEIIAKELLDKLEDIHKQPIILKYISGYSLNEIAEILDIPLGTVKSRIYRGLGILRGCIGREVV